MAQVAQGSSPLARGLPRRPRLRRPSPGIIPARAGFTLFQVKWYRPSRDHPRSRGVYRQPVHDHADRRRIIPARAGFTPTWGVRGRGQRDHPRSRGVYSRGPLVSASVRGSSPLARGLRPGNPNVPGTLRIIPARAGFTRLELGERGEVTDHPRSRGVYRFPPANSNRTVGSSPLARGLLYRICTVNPLSRIIPARAGFTKELEVFRTAGGDHPRSRGVYASAAEARP